MFSLTVFKKNNKLKETWNDRMEILLSNRLA